MAWTTTLNEGRHEDHGNVLLTRQDGRFFVDADEVSMIQAKNGPRRGGEAR